MASKYSISAVFSMIDNVTAPVRRMENATQIATKKMQSEIAKTKMQMKALGQSFISAGKMIGAMAIAGATAVVGDSIKTYVEFEDAVTKAGSKFKDLDVTSSTYQQTLEELQLSAREVGAKTKFSATDAAGALDKMAMAGLSSKQSMAMLFGTTNLAAAAGTDLTTAVDIATDAMGIFGKNLENRGITDVAEQLNVISDVMAKAGVMANTDLPLMFEAMTYAGPALSGAGQSIETIASAIGTLANAGVKGSSAGTALNAVFTQLADDKKVAKLESLGVKVKDARGNFLSFESILGDIQKVTNKMGTFEKTQFLNDVFLVQGGKAISNLLSAGSESFNKLTKELENSKGTAQKIAEAQSNSFAGLIEQLKSAVQDKQISLGKAFEIGGAREALKGLIDYVSTMDVTPIVTFLTTVMQNLPGIVSNIASVVSFLWSMRDVIGAVAIGLATYKTVMVALTVAQGVRNGLALIGIGQTTAQTVATAAQTTATVAQTAATTGATVAQTGLNAVMMANPIGLIVVGIVALGFAIYELVTHWDTVKAVLESFGNSFKNFVSEMWLGLKKIGGSIISFLLTPLIGALDLLSNIPLIGDKIKVGADKLREFQDYAQGGFGAVEEIERKNFIKNSSIPTSLQNIVLQQDEENRKREPITAPVTQGERTSYSVSETNNNEKISIDIYQEKGINSKILNSSSMVNINTLKSSSW